MEVTIKTSLFHANDATGVSLVHATTICCYYITRHMLALLMQLFS
jgi:hypothetical protein